MSAKVFTSRRARAPRAFSGFSERSDYPMDRLVQIEGYDLSNQALYGHDLKNDVKVYVTIRQRPNATQATPNPATERKWNGNRIDQRMADQLKVGSFVALESTMGPKNITFNGAPHIQVTADWISNSPGGTAEKCPTGIFTVKGDRDKVTHFYQFQKNETFSANDNEKIDDLCQKLDEIHAKMANREMVNRMGFRFRLLREVAPGTEEVNGRPGRPPELLVINRSTMVDWLEPEEGSESEIGEPPRGDDFRSAINDYINFVWGADADGENEAIESAFPDEDHSKLRLEISTYNVIKAASVEYNSSLELREPKPGFNPSRLVTMARAVNRYAIGEDEIMQVGKNVGVDSFLFILGNGFDKVEEKVIKNNRASRLFTNAYYDDLDKMLLSADGHKVKVHEDLLWTRAKRSDDASKGATSEDRNGGVSDELGLGGQAEDPFGGSADPVDAFNEKPAASEKTETPAKEEKKSSSRW